MLPVITVFSLNIETYFLWISLTLVVCLSYFKNRAQKNGLATTLSLDLYLVVMISSLICARLIHIFYEQPEYYAQQWSRVFEFWKGGFVYYGGLLGAIIGGVVFLKLKKVTNQLQIFDAAAPVISLGYGLGRWACFWAGCCYGKSCELPWSVAGRHPTQIYSSIWELGVLFLLLGIEPRLKKSGLLFAIWLCLHSLGRFVIEFYRDDFRGPIFILSISGWISVFLFSCGVSFGVSCGVSFILAKKDRV